jgi:hypothetical protein
MRTSQGPGAAQVESTVPMTIGGTGQASTGTAQPARPVIPRPFLGIPGSARTGGHLLMEAMGFLCNGSRGRQPGGGPLRWREFRRAQLTNGRPSRQAVGPREDSTALT